MPTAMSEVTDTHTLPGWTISPGDYGQFEAFSNFLSSRHLSRAADSADGLRLAGKLAAADRVEQTASAAVAADLFALDSPAFKSSMRNYALLPELAYIVLRVAHPDLKRKVAAKLVTPDNERRVWWAIARAWGFRATGVTDDDGEDGGEKKADPGISPDAPTGPASSSTSGGSGD